MDGKKDLAQEKLRKVMVCNRVKILNKMASYIGISVKE